MEVVVHFVPYSGALNTGNTGVWLKVRHYCGNYTNAPAYTYTYTILGTLSMLTLPLGPHQAYANLLLSENFNQLSDTANPRFILTESL